MTRSNGFSLLEVVIVVAVVSLLAVGATLGVGRLGPAQDGRDIGRLFADLIRKEADRAMFEAAARQILLTRDGWQPIRRDDGSQQQVAGSGTDPMPPGWIAAARGFRFPAGLRAEWLGPDGRPLQAVHGVAESYLLTLLPDGRTTPVALQVVLPEGGILRCILPGLAEVSCAES